ncbi:MAG: vitamin B12 dependent methionine synthase [Anaerolineales bacterium]
MDIVVLDKIDFNPHPSRVFKKLHVKRESRYEDLVLGMLEKACQIARPRAMYTIAGIDEKSESGVVIEGIRMESRVMAINLKEVHRVFPYLVTCGRELYDWKMGFEDMLDSYYADEINQMALRAAEKHLLDHLKTTYQLGKTASMNPGSLEDWPITAQQNLFQLLGDPLEAIGVELLDSMLMLPNQTVSGIRFASEDGFSNCELCPREVCPHRRTPYNPDLMDSRYN